MCSIFYCFTNRKKIKRCDVNHAEHLRGSSCPEDSTHPISGEGGLEPVEGVPAAVGNQVYKVPCEVLLDGIYLLSGGKFAKKP